FAESERRGRAGRSQPESTAKPSLWSQSPPATSLVHHMLPNGALYSTFMLLLRAHHCARGRPGSGPACQAFDEVTLHSETQPRRLGNANGSAARYFHLGL